MIKRQLLDKLADNYKFPVPEGLVEGEFNAIWQRIEEAKKAGQKVDDLVAHHSVPDDDQLLRFHDDSDVKTVPAALFLPGQDCVQSG